MEIWATVVIALIVALSTLGATFIQNRHSDKRFERELERAREENQQKRRREVRSEPLLKLRNELARMANKQDNLVAAASRQGARIDGTDEEEKNELQEAAEDWSAYVASGDFAETLLMQYDTDLVNQVEDIRRDYQKSYFYHLHFQSIDEAKLSEAMKVFEKIRPRIVEVQALINKRLEEL